MTATSSGSGTMEPVPRGVKLRFDPLSVERHVRGVVARRRGVFWRLAANRLRRGRAAPIDVEFRSGAPPLKGVEADELRFVLGALTVASSLDLPEAPPAHARRMLEISRRVRARILEQYSRSDVRSGYSGGWPGLKELVLYGLIRRFRPMLAVETGVAQGVSTTFALEALEANGRGRLVSVDLRRYEPPQDEGRDVTFVRPSLATGWAVPDPLRPRWTLLEGPSGEVLPRLTESPDLFCHDSLHTYEVMTAEYEWARGRLPPGGLLVSDDIAWNSAFRDFTRKHSVQFEVVSPRIVGVAVRR